LPTHAHFRELCALASSGQLPPSEADALNGHLVGCDECRSFLADAQRIGAIVIPQVLQAPRGQMRVPSGMRERFLKRAAAEGLAMHAEASFASGDRAESPTVTASPRSMPRFRPGFSLPQWFATRKTWALAAAACLLCFALGAWVSAPNLTAWHLLWPGTASHASGISQATPAQSTPVPPNDAAIDKVRALTAERDQLSRQVANLNAQLKTIEEEKQQAETVWQQKLATAESDALRDHQALSAQSTALNAQTADLRAQLDTLRQQETLAEADLKEQRAKTEEYSARLALFQAQARNQEEVPMASHDEIANLVAARNLHIIDVYDANTKGTRQRPFGRVFYVEGRSLIFYAYDLNLARAQKNITFHLWGEQAGNKETTISLGVLHDDDAHDRRWALSCNDPAILAKINSVYVTAESADRENDAPHGPRVLYAYFGAPPNHP
jgi:hypothetical protein